MNFRIDAMLPAAAARLWELFFDLPRIAALIPGCENVQEKKAHALYAALLNQKIGPFKMSVPTEIFVEEHRAPSYVRLRATGHDKYTGTRLDVLLSVDLESVGDGATRLGVDSTLQVSGRLATLGYPVVKKKSEELFAEFERRLRAELEIA